ncbi:xyloside xylosyltransferase 1 isoform X3 [Cyanistes caeruleus]|uniref:xyloside xylosyltransferase 1 isoform X3 n=1 Tax=Cyanistes caeruleus TaxID=156563 RepID=UPI000CDAB25E|nr:xyloside xylosyltransferase 1 isoform X3 [Cyanistes caeruleus]
MQKHFSAGSGTYYSDSIFFLSVAMHRIMPKEITQIIQVDLDLKYKTNIQDLFDEFDNFPEGAVIGIAREMQPVYRLEEDTCCEDGPQKKAQSFTGPRMHTAGAGRVAAASSSALGTLSGSIAMRTPKPKLGSPLLMGYQASTVVSCS